MDSKLWLLSSFCRRHLLKNAYMEFKILPIHTWDTRQKSSREWRLLTCDEKKGVSLGSRLSFSRRFTKCKSTKVKTKEAKFKGHLSAWCEGQHIEVNCEGQPLWEATSVRFIFRLGNKCEVDFEVRQQMWGYLRLRLRRCEGCGLPAAGGAQVLTPSWHKWVHHHHHQQYPHFHHHSQPLKNFTRISIYSPFPTL